MNGKAGGGKSPADGRRKSRVFTWLLVMMLGRLCLALSLVEGLSVCVGISMNRGLTSEDTGRFFVSSPTLKENIDRPEAQ